MEANRGVWASKVRTPRGDGEENSWSEACLKHADEYAKDYEMCIAFNHRH